ncbi:MAG: cysteine desulfurase NifS [Bacillota bacterium]|nr:cysteine desulfurase NifS [Bacillota bacterium]
MIYMDNAATTKMYPEALKAMLPYLEEGYGNASSIYSLGRDSKKALEDSRATVADCLGADPNEIFFTSGGSEADNWAIRGTAYANSKKGKHIITSNIEHHAVLHTCEALAKEGFEISYIPVDSEGKIKLDELKAAIRDDTILITVMFANNEIGTIEPIAEIAKIANEHGIPFHTDAVQAVSQIPINVKNMGIDMLSLSAHKFHGPKGVGALYIRKGMRPQSIILGGAQESAKRAGTENIAGIVGAATALKVACQDIEGKSKKISALRDHLIQGIEKNIDYCRLNGHRTDRLPGNCNFSFEFIEGESLLLMLDMKGIAASSGSACTSGSLDPSHVLLAIGLKHEIAHGSLRLSLSDFNTEEEVDKVIEELVPIVARLREMSPLYERR